MREVCMLQNWIQFTTKKKKITRTALPSTNQNDLQAVYSSYISSLYRQSSTFSIFSLSGQCIQSRLVLSTTLNHFKWLNALCFSPGVQGNRLGSLEFYCRQTLQSRTGNSVWEGEQRGNVCAWMSLPVPLLCGQSLPHRHHWRPHTCSLQCLSLWQLSGKTNPTLHGLGSSLPSPS